MDCKAADKQKQLTNSGGHDDDSRVAVVLMRFAYQHRVEMKNWGASETGDWAQWHGRKERSRITKRRRRGKITQRLRRTHKWNGRLSAEWHGCKRRSRITRRCRAKRLRWTWNKIFGFKLHVHNYVLFKIAILRSFRIHKGNAYLIGQMTHKHMTDTTKDSTLDSTNSVRGKCASVGHEWPPLY